MAAAAAATSYFAALASTSGVVGSVKSSFFSTRVECRIAPARNVVRLSIRAEDEAAAPAAVEEKAKPAPIGPKRGSTVKILRRESYWYNDTGKVVAVDQVTALSLTVLEFSPCLLPWLQTSDLLC